MQSVSLLVYPASISIRSHSIMTEWRVDIYYSGLTTVNVQADSENEAIIKGREQAVQKLQKATILDPNGSMAQLLQSLEPWEECDTAERL